MSSPGSSLRPGWHKGGSGKGFQPPPTASDRAEKGRSSSWSSQERSDSNKFAALEDEEDGGGNKSNSRSEAFRSSFRGQNATGGKPGRSLADLAASVPDHGAHGAHGTHTGRRPHGGGYGSSRFRDGTSSSNLDYKADPSVIRYTREKLLSKRPPPTATEEIPDNLKPFEATAIVSKEPQDPVCWDTFEAEEIWETFRERRAAAAVPKAGDGGLTRMASGGAAGGEERSTRRNSGGGGANVGGGGVKWQRGVTLPPTEDGRRRDAENPNELWDDPVGGATGAASDFSAFGGIPEDSKNAGDAFDFDKMTEASKEIEQEPHGNKEEDENAQSNPVDSSRPLAATGMMIASGSGDNVNVFEDFDPPTEGGDASKEKAPIRGANEDTNASSRLMKMIGVSKDGTKDSNGDDNGASNPWGAAPANGSNNAAIFGGIGGIGNLSMNPWGGGAPSTAEGNMNMSSVFQGSQPNQNSADAGKRAQEQLLRRRQEEAQHIALQRQQEARQQQAALQQRQETQAQTPSPQSQVEMVLMERIGVILENSWGRSDLASILATLHSEDSRVIPLLSNVDALKALMLRSPQRISLQRDPMTGDMASLLLTNTQFQQAQSQLQQEELRRRKVEESRKQAQQRQAQIDPNAPWFYSDPQNNIQGPFRGEEMRQWLEAGYFKGDLPISQQPSGPFVPLQALFPDLGSAFRISGNSGAKENGSKAAEDEEQRHQQEKAAQEAEAEAAAQRSEDENIRQEKIRQEQERRHEQARQKNELEESQQRSAMEAEAAAAAEKESKADADNSSSSQLKMMLGLSKEKANDAPVALKADEEKKSKSKKNSTKTKDTTKEQPAPTTAPTATKSASPAWGGAANSKPKKMMSEIQQEEARAAAIMAAQHGGASRQSSGWANVASGGKTGWGSGTLKPTPNASQAPPLRVQPLPQGPRQKANQPSSGIRSAPAVSQQNRQSSTASSADEFGASMPPALEKWCKDQMQKINGSDDLTLVAFCMTLNDANEIRQYLTTYLGASGPVNSFAAEFINKRGLGSKNEEWETPGSAKKGRKKKAGK